MRHSETDPAAATKGYRLNKMCYSFNSEANRQAFLADEDGYCDQYGLNDEERAALRRRDKAALMALGGNMYFLAKFDRIPKRG